jgi:hypothetical protein
MVCCDDKFTTAIVWAKLVANLIQIQWNQDFIDHYPGRRASPLEVSTMSRAVSSVDCSSIMNPFMISSVVNSFKLSEENAT